MPVVRQTQEDPFSETAPMSVNLFLDANVFLGFYGLSPADLEELRKLSALIATDQLVLWLPTNVLDEFLRNRSKVLADALKHLRESRLQVSCPAITDGMTERTALQSAVKDAQRKHSELIRAIEVRAVQSELDADVLIGQLFNQARHVDTEHLLQKAKDRRDLRRPPGKADSLGDAVNWEGLLAEVPAGSDIHLVSGDRDFRSPLQQDPAMHEYLAAEWWEAKQARAHLYTDLSAFSKRHFPQLLLATDVIKERAITELMLSPNFMTTHSVVAKLSGYDLFTAEQARQIADAAIGNSQVLWIASDPDVRALLRRLIDVHGASLDPSAVLVLEAAMRTPSEAPPP